MPVYIRGTFGSAFRRPSDDSHSLTDSAPGAIFIGLTIVHYLEPRNPGRDLSSPSPRADALGGTRLAT